MNLNLPFATFLVGVAALIAALVSSGINFLTAWLIRRSEERRQIRELAVRVAIEDTHFVRILGGKSISEDELRTHMRESFAMTEAANQEIQNYHKDNHKKNLTQQVIPSDTE